MGYIIHMSKFVTWCRCRFGRLDAPSDSQAASTQTGTFCRFVPPIVSTRTMNNGLICLIDSTTRYTDMYVLYNSPTYSTYMNNQLIWLIDFTHWYYKDNRYESKYKFHVLYQISRVLLNMFVKNHCLKSQQCTLIRDARRDR